MPFIKIKPFSRFARLPTINYADFLILFTKFFLHHHKDSCDMNYIKQLIILSCQGIRFLLIKVRRDFIVTQNLD